MAGVPVVDIHNHSLPRGFIEHVRSEGARVPASPPRKADGLEYLETPEGDGKEVPDDRSDEALRQRDMAAAGIDITMPSITPAIFNYAGGRDGALWGARAINDGFAEDMKAYPGKIRATAHVPLQFPGDSVKELERAVGELGMRSVQISTNVNGENLDEPELNSFWDIAERLGVLVIIHPHYVVGRHRLTRYHLRNIIGNPLEDLIATASLIFGGVLERYPALKVMVVHSAAMRRGFGGAGDTRTNTARRPSHAAPRSRSTTTSRCSIFDTVIHNMPALRYLVETVGADHVLHGTDYPADMGDWDQVEDPCARWDLRRGQGPDPGRERAAPHRGLTRRGRGSDRPSGRQRQRLPKGRHRL